MHTNVKWPRPLDARVFFAFELSGNCSMSLPDLARDLGISISVVDM
ncbi:MAG: hypothetical protein ISS63_13300 [Desulfobacteraceae bacterium]|nr:hypothetical protein [Desulfobacteraceae bacterium]